MSTPPSLPTPSVSSATAGGRLDVRSRFVVAATRGAFVVGVAASFLPLAWEGVSLAQQAFVGAVVPPSLSELCEAALFAFFLGPLLSWLLLMPLTGRLASWIESLVVPIYRAVVWKPERFEEIYGRPLPGSVSPAQPSTQIRRPGDDKPS